MAKNAAYGINTVKLASPVAGGFPTTFDGDGCLNFKAIVQDSVQFNDAAPGTNDINVEETDDIYATLNSDNGSKGFTMQTYDLSEENYKYLLGFTKDSTTGWNSEPTERLKLIKAVEIVTRTFDDFPSKTFQWAKMDILVTKAGTIGKSGFPNLSLTFKQLANYDADGVVKSGHRWAVTSEIKAGA